MIKPPEEIYPKRKAAEFDESGRPHHFLFYTQRPNFYKLLYVRCIENTFGIVTVFFLLGYCGKYKSDKQV